MPGSLLTKRSVPELLAPSFAPALGAGAVMKTAPEPWSELSVRYLSHSGGNEGTARDCFCKDFYLNKPEKNGIGNLTIDALSRGDLPILKAVTILGALALLLFNLINDLLYAFADPRVRLS